MTDLLQTAFDRMLAASLHGGVMIFVVLAVQFTFGSRLSARWRCAMWGVVFLRLILPTLPPSPWSVMNLTASAPAAPSAATVETITFGVISSSKPMMLGPAPTATVPPTVQRRSMLPGIWLVVALLIVARHLLASMRLSWRIRKRPRGAIGNLPLVETDLVSGPALFGVFRPILLLPAALKNELSADELQLIVQHELAHLRRHDVLVGWLTSIISAMHWFNPLTWLAAARFRADRELACDAAVLAKAQADGRTVYGETILKLVDRFSQPAFANPSAVGFIGSRGAVRRRIVAIAAFTENHSRLSKCIGTILLALIACAALTGRSRGAENKAPADPPVDASVITRTYDVRELLVEIPNFTHGPRLGIVGATTAPAVPATKTPTTEPTKSRLQLVADLMRGIMDEVAPGSWRDRGGSIGSMKEELGFLTITQTPDNMEGVELFLQGIRGTRGTQVIVEVRFISGKGAFAAVEKIDPGKRWQSAKGHEFWPGYLNELQVQSLLRAVQASKETTLVTAPRITLFNGQRAYVLVSRQTAYVSDLIESKNKSATGYDAVISVFQSGVLLDCEANVSADQKVVTLGLRPQLSTLLDLSPAPWPKAPPGKTLTIQVPSYALTNIETTSAVPDQQTMLLRLTPTVVSHSTTQPAPRPEPVLLLVRPKIVIPEDDGEPLPMLGAGPVTRPAKR